MYATVSRRELIRKFETLGFQGPLSGGKHQFMVKGPIKVRVPNPHGSKEIHLSLLKEIIRQAGITLEECDRI
jgi:predicted RNA binding protein YcfA (HicA-like mRNA interferase family)